jgi:hypothetical protein
MTDALPIHRCESIRTCKNPPSEPHTCPYLMDVHQGEPGCDRLCNCCEACTDECADDV